MLPEKFNTPKRNLKRKSKCSNNDDKLKVQRTKTKLVLKLEDEDTKLRLNHIAKSLKESLYRCKECNILSFDKISHLIEKHQDGKTECFNCQKEIEILGIKCHLQNCLNTFLYECGFCNQGFTYQSDATNHYYQCSKTNPSVVIERSTCSYQDSTQPTNNVSACSQDGTQQTDNVSVCSQDNEEISPDLRCRLLNKDEECPKNVLSTCIESKNVVEKVGKPKVSEKVLSSSIEKFNGPVITKPTQEKIHAIQKKEQFKLAIGSKEIIREISLTGAANITNINTEINSNSIRPTAIEDPVKEFTNSDQFSGCDSEAVVKTPIPTRRLLNDNEEYLKTILPTVIKSNDVENVENQKLHEKALSIPKTKPVITQPRELIKTVQKNCHPIEKEEQLELEVEKGKIRKEINPDSMTPVNPEPTEIEDLMKEYMNYDLLSDCDSEVIVKNPDLSGLLLNEDEEFLKNILPIFVESKSVAEKVDKPNELEKGASILDLMKASAKNTSEPDIKKSEDLIEIARKKRRCIEKEEQLRIEEEIEKIRKRKEITFQKLIVMENNETTIIESQLQKILHDIESSSTIADDDYDVDDILSDTEGFIPQDEIDGISKICSELDKEYHDKSFENVKAIDYTGQDHYENKSVNAIYECHLCTEFSTEKFSDFHTHLLNHRKETVVKVPQQKRAHCNICGLVVLQINFSEHLNLHKSQTHCPVCKCYVLYAELESHVLAHKKHFTCMKCGEIYRTKSAIIKHATHHLKGSTYSCEECPAKFASLEKLVCHISFEHKSIDRQFVECPFCFELTDNIKNHVYSTDVCKLKCKTCLKVFKTSEEIINHMEQHQKDQKPENSMLDKIYSCKYCGLRGTKFKSMKTHESYHVVNAMYSKHFPKKPRATCPICQTVVLESYLSHHVKKHRFYDKCPKCRKFIWKQNIDEHIEMHELDHTCGKCEEIFSTEKKLEDHEFAHARLTQRPCTYCNLIFNCEEARWRHASQVHKNIDSEFVECGYCDELLTVNVKFHIYDPNYCQRRCKICDVRFKDYFEYKYHLFSNHNELLEVPHLN